MDAETRKHVALAHAASSSSLVSIFSTLGTFSQPGVQGEPRGACLSLARPRALPACLSLARPRALPSCVLEPSGI